jgi:hypothetical protein
MLFKISRICFYHILNPNKSLIFNVLLIKLHLVTKLTVLWANFVYYYDDYYLPYTMGVV